MPAIIHIAIGSNRRHGHYGCPAAVVAAAVTALDAAGLTVVARSKTRATSPVGPRQRRFANAVVAVASSLPLTEVLTRLQAIERSFGRTPGRRWGPRVLDLDLIAAGDAVVASRTLTVPHKALASRRFVLDPLVEIAPGWRHPLLHLTARQLRARAVRPKSAVPDP